MSPLVAGNDVLFHGDTARARVYKPAARKERRPRAEHLRARARYPPGGYLVARDIRLAIVDQARSASRNVNAADVSLCSRRKNECAAPERALSIAHMACECLDMMAARAFISAGSAMCNDPSIRILATRYRECPRARTPTRVGRRHA